jgi:Kef-type K+ transport system membrane component KefB
VHGKKVVHHLYPRHPLSPHRLINPQDIAVVPFLVLLPLVVGLQDGGAGATDIAAAAANPASLLALLGPTAAKTVLGLGLLLVGGRLLLRRVFEVVAQSDNSETFVGLCLLTVAGAALLTKSLGLSDTMGAFIAGVLLSESSYKTQVCVAGGCTWA